MQPEEKFCKDCKWCCGKLFYAKCHNPVLKKKPDKVSGTSGFYFCETLRDYECSTGSYFEPKPNKSSFFSKIFRRKSC
jgi:hypothetical protein